MSILDYLYGETKSEGVDQTLSNLRPIFDVGLTIFNLVDYLWGEDYNDCLEITVTLKESVLNTFNTKYIMKMLKSHLKDKYRTFLLADYSETGRLHFHGVIKPINGPKGLDYLRRKITKIFGRTEIKPIRQRLQWLTYMVKYYYKYDKLISRTDYVTNDYKAYSIHEKHELDKQFIEDVKQKIEKHIIKDK